MFLPGPIEGVGHGMVMLPADRARADMTAAIITDLRHNGLSVTTATGWEAFDAVLTGSTLVAARLMTSGFPTGYVQVKVMRRFRLIPLFLTALTVAAALRLSVLACAVILALAAAELARGVWRTGPLVRRTIKAVAVPMAMPPVSAASTLRDARAPSALDSDSQSPVGRLRAGMAQARRRS
jgi:hypothetical protein